MALLNRLPLVSTAAIILFVASRAGLAAQPPVNIILDTDVDHDCDDIGALFILHGAAERGEGRLLATMGCTSSIIPGRKRALHPAFVNRMLRRPSASAPRQSPKSRSATS